MNLSGSSFFTVFTLNIQSGLNLSYNYSSMGSDYHHKCNVVNILAREGKIMKKINNIYLQMFQSFFKVGSMSIGGGYVMLPMIQKEVVDVRKWCTEEEVFDFYTLGQSLPGMISVNTATLIGYKLRGIRGAIVSTLGMILPSLVIIMLVASFFSNIKDNIYVQASFNAIRAAVVAIIGAAVVRMGKSGIQSVFSMVLAILAFLLVYIIGISPIFVILAGIAVGVFKSCLKGKDCENEGGVKG